MGCHPSHWRTHIFQDGYSTTNQLWTHSLWFSSGWWFGTMEFYDFPFSWECHHPNWRTPSFFRWVGITTNQWSIEFLWINIDLPGFTHIKTRVFQYPVTNTRIKDLRGKILPGCLAPTATRVARRCELLSGGPFGFSFSHSNGDFFWGMVWDGVDGWIIYHMENHRKMVI